MESNAPSISLAPHSNYIGESFVLSGTVSDPESGVRNIWAGVLKDGKENVLIDKAYQDQSSIPLSITIEPKSLGLTDGPAIIRIAVRDNSWKDWNKGNLSYTEKEVTIDTVPPRADILTRHHNVSQGGSGLVIFRVTEPDTQSGQTFARNE